jgi:uncharacterized membrane protein
MLMLTVVAMFPLYFKAANAGFSAGGGSPEATVSALTRWASWHWVRTDLSVAALAAAIAAL